MISTPSHSQGNKTISGEISENGSGEALIGATIYVEEIASGTVTNIYGFYSLILPPGTYNLKISFVGYDDYLQQVDLQENQTLNVPLDPSSERLTELVIVARPEVESKFDISTVNISANMVKAIPTITGEPDIQQAMLSQSGVTSVGEATTGFNVRGGRIDQNLILVDEAPLYNSSHLFGMMAVVNASSIKDVTFYKGGIPAKFGGRASSVADIHLKEGNNTRFTGEFGVNILVSKLRLEFPIVKEKLSVLVSGRLSYLDRIMAAVLGDETEAALPSFSDATVKINYRINDNNRVYLSGYAGRDGLKLKFVDMKKTETGDYVEKEQETLIDWGDRLVSARWNHVFSPRLFSNLTLYASHYDFSYATNDEEGFGEASANAGEILDVRTYIKGISGKYDFTAYLSNDLALNFGIGASRQEFQPLERVKFDRLRGRGLRDNALDYWGYTDLEMFESRKLSARLGIRYSGWWNFGPGYIVDYEQGIPNSNQGLQVRRIAANKTIKHYRNLEPRVTVNYKIDDTMSVQAAYDRLSQYAHLLTNSYASVPFDSWIGSSYHTPPTRTHQYSLGWNRHWGFMDLSLTAYYKELRNLISFRNGANLILNPLPEEVMLPSKGISAGLEVDANINLKGINTSFNYTYSRSRIKTTSDNPDFQLNEGRTFPSSYDRPHVANLVTSYEIQEGMVVAAKFNLQSGRPTTLPLARVGGFVLYEERNASRLPSNHRLDISLSWIPKKSATRRFKSEFVFSVINVYGRKNVAAYVITSKPDLSGITDLPDPLPLDYVFPEPKEPTFTVKQFTVIGIPVPSVGYNLSF